VALRHGICVKRLPVVRYSCCADKEKEINHAEDFKEDESSSG
jgi:hypothetical protein